MPNKKDNFDENQEQNERPSELEQTEDDNVGQAASAPELTAKSPSPPPRPRESRPPSRVTIISPSSGGDPPRAPRLPETFADERDDVLGVINELEEQLDRYEDLRENLEKELTQTQEQHQAAKQRIQELEWQTVTLQTRLEALEQVRQEVTLLEEEVNDANARAQRLGEQLARTDKEKARLSGELKTAGKQLEELWSARKERDGLRVDIKNAVARLDQLERSHKELQDERVALQMKLQELQLALDEARNAKHQLEMDLRTAENRNEELRSVGEDMKEKLETVRAEKKNLQIQYTHLERENTRLIEQQQFYECELNSLRNMNRHAESALANVKKAFAEVRVALAETKSRARRRVTENRPRPAVGAGGLDATLLDPDEETIRNLAAAMPGRPVAETPRA